MNKVLLILCLVLLSSCSPKEVASGQLVERQGIKYEVNSTTPFTGVVLKYRDNGQLFYKTNHKDGKPHGLEEQYDENGQLNGKGNYKDGKPLSLVQYHENGQLAFKIDFKDGKPHLEESYDENGQLESQSTYEDDVLDKPLPAKPAKPTREIIMDFCADASVVADRSPTAEEIIDIAKYLGVEAKSYEYGDFYMAVLDANVAVSMAVADRTFSEFVGSASSQNIPEWEKACARNLRERIAKWL